MNGTPYPEGWENNMLAVQWSSVTIQTNQQANAMIALFKKIKPWLGGSDTETNGLHIISSTLFLFQFGFVHPNLKEGYTFAVDLERQPKLASAVIRAWLQLAETLDVYLGHNIIFELHMMTNAGFTYTKENLSDTMFYIRYANDAVAPKNGGVPLKLKEFAARYVDSKAKHHEQLLLSEQAQIAKELNLKLKLRLRKCGIPPAKFHAKSYTLTVIKDMFKDPIMDYHDLPSNIKEVYLEWLQHDVPIYLQPKITGLVESEMIPYNILNRENLIRYGHYDIIYMLEVFLYLEPLLKNRNNNTGIEIENKLIYPIFEMERVGFKADKEYIQMSRARLKEYIKERRQILYDLANRELCVGQHDLIKRILNEDFCIAVESTKSEELEHLHSELLREHGEVDVVKFIEVIQELRTLEKWYSTYLTRFLFDLREQDRLYATINLVGAVSGRVTSAFQQFPRTAIKTVTGEEIFHPRKMIIPSGGDYDAIVYLDYSQIELRIQALYTILVGDPDLNLCRAYMPYQCVDHTGVLFDCNNPEHVLRWQDDWFLEEEPSIKWTPVDVHAVTTFNAIGMTPDHPDFKEMRTEIGKKTNFAKNYGAKIGRIRQMYPTKSESEIKQIDAAYYKSFPGILNYHRYCYDRADDYSYTTNLFGIKYYGMSGHKLINGLIQGSSAYILKHKIRELWEYSKQHQIKSRFQMNLHDELSWERHIDDFDIFFEYQKIMQEWPDLPIPIVAELAFTKTNWADKKEVKTKDDLRLHFSH